MDAAVPVEASIENRVKHARRYRVGITQEHVIKLVRIFLAHVIERDPRHVRGEFGDELRHRRNPAI